MLHVNMESEISFENFWAISVIWVFYFQNFGAFPSSATSLLVSGAVDTIHLFFITNLQSDIPTDVLLKPVKLNVFHSAKSQS